VRHRPNPCLPCDRNVALLACSAGSARFFVASALARCFYACQTNGVVATAGRDGPERALLQAIESRQVQVLGMVRNERFAEFIRLQMLAQPELRQCFVFGLGHFLDHAATCSGAFLRLPDSLWLWSWRASKKIAVARALKARLHAYAGNDVVQLLNEVHGRTVRYVPAEENICATVFGSSDAPTMPPLPEPWMARGDPWVPDGTSSVRRWPSDAACFVARLAYFQQAVLGLS